MLTGEHFILWQSLTCCCGVHGLQAPTNTHYVPFRLNGSSNARGGQQRQKKAEKEQNAGARREHPAGLAGSYEMEDNG